MKQNESGRYSNESNRFELGEVVVTRGVDEQMEEDPQFRTFVLTSLGRYVNCDWGDTCKEDAASNEMAVKNGERILAVYKKRKTEDTIWIITEWDRSVTTILFPEEY